MPTASQSTSDFKGDHLSVKMFGAVGDGVTDDTAAWQAALTYFLNGGTLVIPRGDYVINSQLTMKNTVGLKIEGLGQTGLMSTAPPAVKIIYTPATGDVFKLEGVRGFEISGINVTFSDPGFNGNVFNLLHGTGAGDCSHIRIHDNFIGSNIQAVVNITGTAMVWVSGTPFTDMAGCTVLVNGKVQRPTVASVTDSHHATLSFAPGNVTAGVINTIGPSVGIGMAICSNIVIERNFFYLLGVPIQGDLTTILGSNQIAIRHNWFDQRLDYAIKVGGQQWTISDNVFEPKDGAATGYNFPHGDGTTTMFTLAGGVLLNVQPCVVMQSDGGGLRGVGQHLNVGLHGTDTGKDVYWEPGTGHLYTDPSWTTLASDQYYQIYLNGTYASVQSLPITAPSPTSVASVEGLVIDNNYDGDGQQGTHIDLSPGAVIGFAARGVISFGDVGISLGYARGVDLAGSMFTSLQLAVDDSLVADPASVNTSFAVGYRFCWRSTAKGKQQSFPTDGFSSFDYDTSLLLLPPSWAAPVLSAPLSAMNDVLIGAITATASTLTLNSGLTSQNGMVLTIGTEQLWILSGGGTASLTVQRGFNGTTPAAHAGFATVTGQIRVPGSFLSFNGLNVLQTGAGLWWTLSDGSLRFTVPASKIIKFMFGGDPGTGLTLNGPFGDVLGMSGNAAAHQFTMGISQNALCGLIGDNLVFQSANLWNTHKDGIAWYIGRPAGGAYVEIAASNAKAGTGAGTDTALTSAIRIVPSNFGECQIDASGNALVIQGSFAGITAPCQVLLCLVGTFILHPFVLASISSSTAGVVTAAPAAGSYYFSIGGKVNFPQYLNGPAVCFLDAAGNLTQVSGAATNLVQANGVSVAPPSSSLTHASAAATSALTLTTSMVDVPGATVSLVAGVWLITAAFGFGGAVGDGDITGALNVGGALQTALARITNGSTTGGLYVTAAQYWVVTLGSTTTCKLQAKKSGASGTGICDTVNTTITAVKIG